MPKETAVVGDQRCQFVYQSADNSRNFYERDHNFMIDAVALTFARDRDQIPGIYCFHCSFDLHVISLP